MSLNRYRLFSPNFQELPAWKGFADAIDEVFKDKIDDPQVVFRLLRNTFGFGPSSYTNINDESLVETFDLTGVTTSLFLRQIVTGYPEQNHLSVYRKPTGNPDSDYALMTVPLYNTDASNRINFSPALPAGTTVKVVPRALQPSGTYDISNLYNFSGPVPSDRYEVFDVVAPQTIFNLPTSKPELVTGYPTSNRILVYSKLTTQSDVFYQFVPQSYYNITTNKQIVFLTPQVAGTTVKVVLRPHSVEVSRKLNQLGFDYDDLDFVTLPSEYENSDITQVMSDLIGNYYIHSKGTKSFADFFGYVFKAVFRVEQQWAEDLNDDEYHNFQPHGSPLIGTPVWAGGTWYPTSHVKIYYDLVKFGNSLNERAVKDFFLYISPINLVVIAIVLETITEGDLYIGGSPAITIHYL